MTVSIECDDDLFVAVKMIEEEMEIVRNKAVALVSESLQKKSGPLRGQEILNVLRDYFIQFEFLRWDLGRIESAIAAISKGRS